MKRLVEERGLHKIGDTGYRYVLARNEILKYKNNCP